MLFFFFLVLSFSCLKKENDEENIPLNLLLLESKAIIADSRLDLSSASRVIFLDDPGAHENQILSRVILPRDCDLSTNNQNNQNQNQNNNQNDILNITKILSLPSVIPSSSSSSSSSSSMNIKLTSSSSENNNNNSNFRSLPQPVFHFYNNNTNNNESQLLQQQQQYSSSSSFSSPSSLLSTKLNVFASTFIRKSDSVLADSLDSFVSDFQFDDLSVRDEFLRRFFWILAPSQSNYWKGKKKSDKKKKCEKKKWKKKYIKKIALRY